MGNWKGNATSFRQINSSDKKNRYKKDI